MSTVPHTDSSYSSPNGCLNIRPGASSLNLQDALLARLAQVKGLLEKLSDSEEEDGALWGLIELVEQAQEFANAGWQRRQAEIEAMLAERIKQSAAGPGALAERH